MPQNLFEMIGLSRQSPLAHRKRNNPIVNVPQTESAFLDPENQALDSSFLDPAMYFGGGAIMKGIGKGVNAGNKAGTAYMKNARNNRTSGQLLDPSKRTANIALGAGLGKIADPTFIPSALAAGVGLGVKQPGVGGVIKGMADITKSSAINLARAKNFRLNKKAGLSNTEATIADKIATTSLKLTKPINNVSKVTRAKGIKDDFLNSDVKDVGKFALDVL